ncbi:MAG: hypothetical protein H6839_06980 [Planctomycetes bacterium]|nr:hypothetical protein [Planctomycetota bacterium]
MKIVQVTLAVWMLCTLLACSSWAAFSGQGINGTFSGPGRSAAFFLEADFGGTAHTEAWSFVMASSTDAPLTIILMEIPTMSTATSATAFNGGFLQGTFTPPSAAGGSGTLTYNTPTLSGIHRFVYWMQVTSGTLPTTVSITMNNGSQTATATTDGGNAWDVYTGYSNIGASGSSLADTLYQPNNMRVWTTMNAAGDTFTYDADIDHGGTATSLPMSIYATFSAGTGSGDVNVDLYDMTLDGGQSPVASVVLTGAASAGFEDAKNYVTPSRTGVHKYRVVITPGAGFSVAPEVYSHLCWGGQPPFSNPVTPITDYTPVAISPASSTLSTSPATLTGSGGSGSPASYDWTLQGTVPAGVTLSSPTGATTDLQFSGATSGSTVTVRCANGSTGEYAEETYTLTPGGGGGGTLTITTTSLSNGQVGVSYNETITATASSAPGPYTWSLSSGTLPGGLTLDTASTTLTTTLSGTPNTPGTFNFTVQITNGSASDTQSYQVDITASGVLTITTTSLVDGTVGTPYSANIVAVGGTGNHTWSVISGALPAGLTLGSSTTGTVSITGNPTTAGPSGFTIQVVDSSGTPQTDTQAFTLTVNTGGGGGGPGGISGGGGGGGGGCVATSDNAPWMLMLGLLAMFGLALRMRSRRA